MADALQLAQTDGGSNAGGGLFQLLFWAVLIAGFYFLLIRPQRMRQKQMQQMQSQAEVGSEVMTSSGIYGRIVGTFDDDTLQLEIAPGVAVRIARPAIVRVIEPLRLDGGDEPPAT